MMTEDQTVATPTAMPPGRVRTFAIGTIAFLTLVDLFATQAILPALARSYGVSAAEIGVASNSSTIGMALGGVLAGLLTQRFARRTAITACLLLLAIPTLLLSFAPPLPLYALLRVTQGLFMAGAFTLTLAHFSERCSARDVGTALAAYVTGVVASNLFGRLVATMAASYLGAVNSFALFAALNIAGAAFAWTVLTYAAPLAVERRAIDLVRPWGNHLRHPRRLAAFAIGFLILFGFVGIFSYVGFVLTAAPFGLSMMATGLVFLCFAPAMLTTPAAARIVARHGTARTLPAAMLLAVAGVLMSAASSLPLVIVGLALVGVGTFFAQAAATAWVSRNADGEPAAASALYLFFYYAGGLAGATIIGMLFVASGWLGAVLLVGAIFIAAALLGRCLREPLPTAPENHGSSS